MEDIYQKITLLKLNKEKIYNFPLLNTKKKNYTCENYFKRKKNVYFVLNKKSLRKCKKKKL